MLRNHYFNDEIKGRAEYCGLLFQRLSNTPLHITSSLVAFYFNVEIEIRKIVQAHIYIYTHTCVYICIYIHTYIHTNDICIYI